MADYINGINPIIIKWARERSGYTLEDVRQILQEGCRNHRLIGSLAKLRQLIVQLEKLADKYKRPVALFFFPEPPPEPDFVAQPALRSAVA